MLRGCVPVMAFGRVSLRAPAQWSCGTTSCCTARRVQLRYWVDSPNQTNGLWGQVWGSGPRRGGMKPKGSSGGGTLCTHRLWIMQCTIMHNYAPLCTCIISPPVGSFKESVLGGTPPPLPLRGNFSRTSEQRFIAKVQLNFRNFFVQHPNRTFSDVSLTNQAGGGNTATLKTLFAARRESATTAYIPPYSHSPEVCMQ